MFRFSQCSRLGMLAVAFLAALLFASTAPADAIGAHSNVSGETLKSLVDHGITVVDVRRADEWRATGVVSGAILITAFDEQGRFNPAFPKAFAAAVAPDQPVVLICRSGRRSTAVAEMITGQPGYTKVYNADGGILTWQRNGYALEPCPSC